MPNRISLIIYLSDVGLLTYKSGISASLLLGDIGFDNEFVGGLVELCRLATAPGYPFILLEQRGQMEVDSLSRWIIGLYR